jgi:DNA gyrase/topoisomerase IV subunit A
MISLIDDGIIIYVNDNATKDNPYDLEVVFRRKEDFETYIHKHLIKTENYKFYALERTKSDSVEKDIDTKILVPNMIQVMNKWIDWRKVVETNIIDLDMKKIEDKKIKAELRLSAAEHLSIVKKALESNDTEDTFIKELPIFKNIDKLKWNDSAQYLCDLKLSALKKMDIEKIKSEIEDYTKNLKLLDNDKKHIDKVVERELDKLSEFYKPRTLKI